MPGPATGPLSHAGYGRDWAPNRDWQGPANTYILTVAEFDLFVMTKRVTRDQRMTKNDQSSFLASFIAA